SRSAPTSNCTVILLLPSALVEVRDLIPWIPLICSSSGSVIWASMTSAFAPTYEELTLITGGSKLGYSQIHNNEIPIPPNSRITRDITMANTGRLILILDKLAILIVVNWVGSAFPALLASHLW